MTKNIVYDKNGIPKISYRTEKGTVRIKELKNKRIYKNKEIIKYLYFFAALKSEVLKSVGHNHFSKIVTIRIYSKKYIRTQLSI